MQCRAIPYEGNEPYVFFSYSHKDAQRAYPMLEQMVRDGFRVWYDDGNHAGDDWLENIAQHLNRCTVCLAILSENSEQSHNCKKEVSFAVQCNKKLLAIMLEKFAMTVGMRMQLSTIHYLTKTDYPSDAALLAKLYESECLSACKGAPGSMPMRQICEQVVEQPAPGPEKEVENFLGTEIPREAEAAPVVVHAEQEIPAPEPVAIPQPASEPAVIPQAQKKIPLKVRPVSKVAKKEPEQICEEADVAAQTPTDEQIVEDRKMVIGAATETPEVKKQTPETPDCQPQAETVSPAVPVAPAEAEEAVAEPVAQTPAQAATPMPQQSTPQAAVEEEEDERTVYMTQGGENEDGESATITVGQAENAMLIRLSNRQVHVVTSALTRIGRSKNRCDFEITENPSVSNHHADMVYYKDVYYIKDAGSKNGTFLGEERLAEGEQKSLSNLSVFRVSDEQLLLIYGADAVNAKKAGMIAYLQNPETKTVQIVGDEGIFLDRSHKWSDGTLKDGKISRDHAVIRFSEGKFTLEDVGSRNGTFLDGVRLAPEEKRVLQDKATIRLADTNLEFGIISM